jgi:uncharacterized protein
MSTLDMIENSFSHPALEKIYSPTNEGIVLADIELKSGDFAQLKLMRSKFTREGDLGLYLFNEQQQEVYGLTFSFGDKGELFVSGLQGPASENAAELVKSMTKLMHGMRPKNYLSLRCMRSLNHWVFHQLLAYLIKHILKASV